MSELSGLVEFFNLHSSSLPSLALAPLALAASGAAAFGAWRAWAPVSPGLAPLQPALPPSLGVESRLARSGAEACVDGDLLGLSVPGGGE